MRTATLSVLVSAAALVAAQTPAHAADSWFAPYVETAIDNGNGPGPAPRGTDTADFDSDGIPDIVTITDGAQGDILLATGDGDGTFTPAGEIAGTAGVQGIDVGDVNRDGHADVIGATTSDLLVRYGDGDGGFTSGTTYPQTLGGQVNPRLVDLDADGDLDVAAPTFTAIQTLINNGDGTFVAGPTTEIPGSGALAAISPSDLDGDSHADLFAVDGMSGTTFALRGDGTGAFAVTGSLYSSGLVPEDVAAIDLNGDGYDDAATVGSFSFTLVTALTDGQGGFTSVVGTTQFAGSGPTSLTVTDLDGDGRQDVAISYLANWAPAVKVLAGIGTVTMSSVGDFEVGSFPQNPVITDFDGDGRPDIVTAGPGALSFLSNTTS